MKPRNREINIFNMSLLDILCGALGAFCFLMLVLFPYYNTDKTKTKAPEVPPGIDPKNYQEAMGRIKQLEETLRKFQNYAAQLQGQVSQLQAQVSQLQAKNQDAAQKVGQLEFRNPFLALVSAGSATKEDDVEIWVEDDRSNAKKQRSPRLDPNQRQGPFWAGDLALSKAGLDVGYFLVRDGPPGEYRIFIKVLKHDPAARPLDLWVVVQTNAQRTATPVFYCTKPNLALLVAVVKVDADYNQNIEMRSIPQELTVRPATK